MKGLQYKSIGKGIRPWGRSQIKTVTNKVARISLRMFSPLLRKSFLNSQRMHLDYHYKGESKKLLTLLEITSSSMTVFLRITTTVQLTLTTPQKRQHSSQISCRCLICNSNFATRLKTTRFSNSSIYQPLFSKGIVQITRNQRLGFSSLLSSETCTSKRSRTVTSQISSWT